VERLDLYNSGNNQGFSAKMESFPKILILLDMLLNKPVRFTHSLMQAVHKQRLFIIKSKRAFTNFSVPFTSMHQRFGKIC